ncbi:MAG: DUF3592 domain-containing protein [Chloroflexi bacterium]|jgi:hypothetical protein|nr:DUF3592 domain-containing protein [Chloroflexota bacterium]
MTVKLPRTAVEPAILLPPRAVPLCTWITVLFGGVLQQIGWFFLGFGMIFFYVFGLEADLSGLWMRLMDTRQATGLVTSVEDTNASENESPVYAIHYRYVAANGTTVDETAYSTGYYPDAGQRVTVEYLRSNPEVSRVEGMRRTTFGPAAIFVVIFPLVGAALAFFGLVEGIRASHLLRIGRLAFGKLTSTAGTNTTINNRQVMAMTLSFRAHDGATYDMTSRTNQPENLDDQAEELILYDPDDPTRGAALDALPGKLQIDQSGTIRLGRPIACLTTLIVPGLTILGHGLYLFFRFVA